MAAAVLFEAPTAPLAVQELKRKLAVTPPHKVLRVLATASMPPREKVVLQVLWCHAIWEVGETHPSLREEDVIKEACISRATFYRARDQLVAWGLLEIVPATRNQPCVYVFPWRLGSHSEAVDVSDCDPIPAEIGSQIETLTEQPFLLYEEHPPHDLSQPTNRHSEEDESSSSGDGPGTKALMALGMTRDEANHWAAQHSQAVLEEAGTLTRERATIDAVRYVRKVLTNWLTIPSPGTRARMEQPERSPWAEVGERLAAEEAQWQNHFATLRQRFEALPAAEQARLLDEARRRVPMLQGRPSDHPLVQATALNLLGELQA